MASGEEAPSSPEVQAAPSLVPHTLREQIYREFAELDAQEQAIVRKRVELKQLLNSFLPIYKLPNELLVRVFSDFRDVCDKQTKDFIWLGMHTRTQINLDWLGLMLVCRHWRDVLVSTPSFWREINTGSHVAWINLCLRRSATAPVDVLAGFRDSSRLDVLHPHVHRFQTFLFDMTNRTHELQTTLPPLFGRGMPLLECLHFNGKGPGDNGLDIYLTSERFPHLRTLVLTQTMAPRDISLYSQLRTLELNFCHHTLSFEGFLDALAASVQLEELSIYETLSSLISEDPTWPRSRPVLHGRPPVLLPCLRNFTLISNSIVHTSRLLAHLHLNPFAILDISADASESGLGHNDTTSSYSAMLPPNPCATLPSLAVATAVSMMIQDGACELRYDHPSPRVPPADSISPDVTLYLELNRRRSAGPFIGTALDDIVRCFGRSPLTSLVVHGNHTYGTAAAWESIFRTFPLLKELGIGGHPSSDVTGIFRGLHAASESTSTSTSSRMYGDASGSVACPNLERVRARGVGSVEAYDAVRECFRRRGERGAIVKTLDLSDLRDQDASISDVRCALVEDLRGAVESLQVYSCCEHDGK